MQKTILPLNQILKSSDKGREYWKAEYSGKNESGFNPVGDKVLIIPDQGAETTSGGVMLTPEMIERHTLASETGVVVEVGSRDAGARGRSSGDACGGACRCAGGDFCVEGFG